MWDRVDRDSEEHGECGGVLCPQESTQSTHLGALYAEVKTRCLSQVLPCWETVTKQRKAEGQRGHWEVGIVSKQCRWDWDQAERGKETGRRKRSCIKAINHLGWILSLKCNLYNIVCISKKCRRRDGRRSGSVGCVWACVCVGCSGIPNIFIILFAKTLTCGFSSLFHF